MPAPAPVNRAPPPPPPNLNASTGESFGYFGQVGTGIFYSKEVTPRPGTNGKGCTLSLFTLASGGKNCANAERNTVLFSALAGARTRNSDVFFFLAYYKFSLFWDIDGAQTGSFGNWFQSPRSATSPLPTRGLLQVHEIFSDSRYLSGPMRYGLQLQLSLGRSNLQFFAQTGEEAATSYTSEAAVPYVIYVMNRFYRARLYMPIYTVVSREDKDFTYTTFSMNSRGRGRAFSIGLSNQFFAPAADLLVNWDLSRLDYKFRSVTNDRTRTSTSVAATYTPEYARGGFLMPKIGYFTDSYYLPTVVIDDFSLEPDAPTSVGEPLQVKRVDQGLNYGLTAGFDFFGQHRLQGETSFTSVKSNLPDRPLAGTLFLLRYLWTFPSTNEVGRFLRYTERNPLNGTFEGDGGH